ncbi:MAG: transcriptional regulator [Firmicutes bacterium]|nr:transcriptional regulator [Bacillota bacterium]
MLEDGLKQALAACQAGAQVIISRGGTAAIIRKHVNIPILEAKVTSHDLLRVIAPYRNQKKTLGVIGYESIVHGCRRTCELLTIAMEEIIISNDFNEDVDWLAVQNKAQNLVSAHGIKNIIGDTLIASKLTFKNVNVHLITSGKEALLETIDEARHIVQVREEERAVAERFKTVINIVREGIIAVDEHEQITVINPAAEAIFNLTADDILGQPIKNFIDHFHIGRILKSGRAEMNQVQKISRGYILSNQIPIQVDGEAKGVVATFQEIKKIQDAEQSIRQNLYTQGFVTKYRFNHFITSDPSAEQMIHLARNYAKANATVLIQGESGTGKEILAQSIHSDSRRANGPFVAINCAALPPQLLESELFGYVEGAFTGAKKGGKPGLFELAHKGTIFLDEVGDIDSVLQGRLLRVLQEKQVMRIGSDAIIPVDIRIIAATNRHLNELVTEGRFRMDLYYRLNVLNLRTIPLRERNHDIMLLAAYFLKEFAAEYGCCPENLPAEMMDRLTQHHWPGNVRELKNVIERFAVQTGSKQPSSSTTKFILEDLSLNSEPLPATQESFLTGNLQEIKRKAILTILAEEEYNKTRTAKRLGIDRATIDRLLERPKLKP